MIFQKLKRVELLIRGVLTVLCAALVFAQLALPLHLVIEHHSHACHSHEPASSVDGSERCAHEPGSCLRVCSHSATHSTEAAHDSLTCPQPERDIEHETLTLLLNRSDSQSSLKSLMADLRSSPVGLVSLLELRGSALTARLNQRGTRRRMPAESWHRCSGPAASTLRLRAPPA